MKVMRLHSYGPVENSPLAAAELPPPKPGERELLVAVSCCGICRTDLHVIEKEIPPHNLPITPGHQIVGRIADFGPGCRRFSGGERVGIAWLRHTCGDCSYCRSGRENLCPFSKYTGYDTDGGFAGYAVVHEDYCYEIPAVFTDEDAAPLLCAGIIGYRSLERAELPQGGRLAIFGFGSSAHIVAQLARHRGSEFVVITRGEKHRRLARELGASWVGETAQDFNQRFGHKVQSAIIFAPAGELIPQALTILDRGGTLSLAGIHMTDVPAMNYEKHLFYEKNIRSVTSNTRQDGEEFLKEAAGIPLQPKVKIYPLEQANLALQDLKADRIEASGVLRVETDFVSS